MVFHHTANNVKQLRNLILEYDNLYEMTAHEFMQAYIEKWPQNMEESRLTWMVEKFLCLQKHRHFLREVVTRLAQNLTQEEQDYFIIILHGITFHILPKDMNNLYKTLFHLSKTLLHTFTKILSNNEVLTYISQVAQSYYDANYITEKIIGPLFVWQPYISEMDHNYAEYLKKVEKRRLKPVTVPIHPTVLTRKGKEQSQVPSLPPIPITPPNSFLNKGKKMLTKNTIDRRLKVIHEKNKQKANELLNAVKNNDLHLARPKPKLVRTYTISDLEQVPFNKPKNFFPTSTLPPVRQNIATVKRINKLIATNEQQEVDWLESLLSCCRNYTRIDDLVECERIESEREYLYDIEKKHLMGLLSFEEAVLAKQKVQEQNKEKYNDYLREKEEWNKEIEQWKQEELIRKRHSIESLAFLDFNIIHKKNAILEKNKEKAENIKKESEEQMAEILKAKKEELDRKIKMIKEIKLLTLIAKKARVPKVIDLTESSGVGLLCEMSIAELQERLVGLKLNLKDELEKRKTMIKEEKELEKKKLEDLKNYNQIYAEEREMLRKQRKPKTKLKLEPSNAKEINDLKKLLEEKRSIRVKAL